MNNEGASQPPPTQPEDVVLPAENGAPRDYYCRNCERVRIYPPIESYTCPECHGPLAELSIPSVLLETFEEVNFAITRNGNVNIPQIPSVQISAADVRNALKCSVCLDEFLAKETVSRTECRHVFHISCINQWLEQQQSCPNCRARVDPTGNSF